MNWDDLSRKEKRGKLELEHYTDDAYDRICKFVKKNINDNYPLKFYSTARKQLKPLLDLLTEDEIHELATRIAFKGLKWVLYHEFYKAYRKVKHIAEEKVEKFETRTEIQEITEIAGGWWEITFEPQVYYRETGKTVRATKKDKQEAIRQAKREVLKDRYLPTTVPPSKPIEETTPTSLTEFTGDK